MTNWRYRLARTIIHCRIYIVIACCIISAFFIGVLKDIRVETQLEDFLPQEHSFIHVQHQLTDIFGGLNQVSIGMAVVDGTIFTADFLEKVVLLTEDLGLTEGVNLARIQSIASRHIKHVVANEEGFFVERLLRFPPDTEEGMEALKQKVINNPTIYGPMVSEDLKSTLIQVDFESATKTSYIFEVLQRFKAQYEDDNTRIYIAGRPILEGWLNFYLPRMLGVLALSFLVISIVLYLTFRSKRGVILPLLDSSMATLWGMGAMKLMGLRLDPSTILVPFIILSLGISHSVHTLKRYYEEMVDPNRKSKYAVANTMAHLFLPGLACVLTDGFGFLSLILVPLPTIRSMALASGLGILANFFTSFMFTPCILSWMHRPKILEVRREESHKWVDGILRRLSVFSLNKRAGTVIVSAFIVITVISFFGIHRIVIGDNTQGSSYLYPNTPYNRAERFINTNFGGTNSYYILVESDESLLTVASLTAMDDFKKYLLREVPQAGSAHSVVDAIKALNMFMFDGKRSYFTIPDNDDTVYQYWFLYTYSGFPSDYDHLISKDERQANIKFDLKDHMSSTVSRVVEATRDYFNTHRTLPAVFSFAGGDTGMLYAINDIIRRTLIPNILFISCLIFFYVSFIYRSFTAGWILFLPLVFSNAIVFSLYGFLGTSLTTETLALAALSQGLGINYGIYIVARLHDEMRRKAQTYKDILCHTLITSGKAVFFSGFIVSAGIFVWVFSPILFQAKLGLNLCLALILNMITSLIMIPVFVWWIKPRFLFGRVRLRLEKRNTQNKGGNKMKKVFVLFGAMFFMAGALAQAQGLEYYTVYTPKSGMSADDIMRIKYHNKYSLFARDYYTAENEVFYVAPSGFTRTKVAKRQRIVKGGDSGLAYKDLVVVTDPTQVKGLAILTWTYEDMEKDQDVWLWIPSQKKSRKISASEDDDAFMGSDLTVEEVSTRRFEDETYRLLREENFAGYTLNHTGETKYAGEPCFVIEATTKKPHWYYAKRVVWVDKKMGANIYEEYYDRNGKKFKTIFRETVIYDPAGKRYPMASIWECVDLRTGHYTVIFPKNTLFDQGLNESDFTVRMLQRSRW